MENLLEKITGKEVYKIKVKDNDVILGDDKSSVFKPKLTFTKWNKEVNLSVTVPSALIASPIVSIDKDRLEFKDSKVGFYSNLDQDNEENFKFGLMLFEKPLVNSWTFSLEGHEDLEFRGPIPESIDIGDKILHPLSERVGGYSIFHKTKKHNQYQTGKIGVFLCPVFIDASGVREKAVLKIKDGDYTVSVSQEFLDNAVYPVKANDTFGNTTTPDGYDTTNADYMRVSPFTLGVAGNVSKLTTYLDGVDAAENVKGVIYDDSGSGEDPTNLEGVSNVTSIDTTAQQYDLTFASPVVLTAAMYHLGRVFENNGNSGGYDFSDEYMMRDEADSGGYASPTTFGTPARSNNVQWCIYATYTAGGAPASATGIMTTRTNFWGDV